jgi:uncharacterized protein YlxW (UPF0749 family)
MSHPEPDAMHRRRSQVTIAVVAFLLGLLVVVQLRTQASGSALQNTSTQDLTTLVGSLNTRNDQLRTEISSLQSQLDELRADKANGATSLEEIQSELARIRAWAGVDAVSGRGVTIVVGGAIDAAAVDDLLNELRNAGAEAIAIESIRVVPGTTISGVPGALDVNGFLLRDPFMIRAVGRPDSLVGSLTRAGGIIAQLAATTPSATIELQPSDEPMTLPATSRNLVPSHGHPRL